MVYVWDHGKCDFDLASRVGHLTCLPVLCWPTGLCVIDYYSGFELAKAFSLGEFGKSIISEVFFSWLVFSPQSPVRGSRGWVPDCFSLSRQKQTKQTDSSQQLTANK